MLLKALKVLMNLLNVELSMLIIFERSAPTTLVFMYLLPQVANCIIHLLQELFSLLTLFIFTFKLFFSLSFPQAISPQHCDRVLFQAIFAHHLLTYIQLQVIFSLLLKVPRYLWILYPLLHQKSCH